MKQSYRTNKSVCSEIDSIMMSKDKSEIGTEGFHIVEFVFCLTSKWIGHEQRDRELLSDWLDAKSNKTRMERRGRRRDARLQKSHPMQSSMNKVDVYTTLLQIILPFILLNAVGN